MDRVQKHSNPERNLSYSCSDVTICYFSTDDEPDSVFLHVPSSNEEQKLWNKLGNITLRRPISSSVNLHSSRTASWYWTSAHIVTTSVLILTRPLTSNGYKLYLVVRNKYSYSKRLTFIYHRPTHKSNRFLFRPICSIARLTTSQTLLLLLLLLFNGAPAHVGPRAPLYEVP
jgi:hypothetical protein